MRVDAVSASKVPNPEPVYAAILRFDQVLERYLCAIPEMQAMLEEMRDSDPLTYRLSYEAQGLDRATEPLTRIPEMKARVLDCRRLLAQTRAAVEHVHRQILARTAPPPSEDLLVTTSA